MIPRFITQAAMQQVFAPYVIATDVVAFDVRAYDPNALGYTTNNVSLLPSDVGYAGPYGILRNHRTGATTSHCGPTSRRKWTMPGASFLSREATSTCNWLTIIRGSQPASTSLKATAGKPHQHVIDLDSDFDGEPSPQLDTDTSFCVL